jgi:hypothetical protein
MRGRVRGTYAGGSGAFRGISPLPRFHFASVIPPAVWASVVVMLSSSRESFRAWVVFLHPLAYSQMNDGKKGRVNRRQCNTGDTVGTDMRKRSGQFPECKNKINK